MDILAVIDNMFVSSSKRLAICCTGFLTMQIFVVEAQTETLPPGYQWNENTASAYKLMKIAQTWDKARTLCETDSAYIAVPDTQEEFAALQSMVRLMHYPEIVDSDHKLLVWLGISNLADYRVWKNVHGQDIRDTKFNAWAGQNGVGYSNNPSEPHCVAIDSHNKGLRDWWCDKKLAYICEFTPLKLAATTNRNI